MKPLYFVRATERMNGDVVFAGHWIASSPADARAIAQAVMRLNTFGPTEPLKYEWSARQSPAARTQALNKE